MIEPHRERDRNSTGPRFDASGHVVPGVWRDWPTGAAGRLMANVLASVAQYETEVRAERIIAGQAVARAKGPGKPIKVTPEQEETARRLTDRRAKKVKLSGR